MDDSEFAELNSQLTADDNIEASAFLPFTMNLTNFRESTNDIIYLGGSDSDVKSYYSQR